MSCDAGCCPVRADYRADLKSSGVVLWLLAVPVAGLLVILVGSVGGC